MGVLLTAQWPGCLTALGPFSEVREGPLLYSTKAVTASI